MIYTSSFHFCLQLWISTPSPIPQFCLLSWSSSINQNSQVRIPTQYHLQLGPSPHCLRAIFLLGCTSSCSHRLPLPTALLPSQEADSNMGKHSSTCLEIGRFSPNQNTQGSQHQRQPEDERQEEEYNQEKPLH